MVVHLPGGGEVVIDSKVPLDAFLHFTEAQNEEDRKIFLTKHARQLRTHVDQLAKKEYWKQFDGSPEFVVAFIPGEPLLAAASKRTRRSRSTRMKKRVAAGHARTPWSPRCAPSRCRLAAGDAGRERPRGEGARGGALRAACGPGRVTCSRSSEPRPRASRPTTRRWARSSLACWSRRAGSRPRGDRRDRPRSRS